MASLLLSGEAKIIFYLTLAYHFSVHFHHVDCFPLKNNYQTTCSTFSSSCSHQRGMLPLHHWFLHQIPKDDDTIYSSSEISTLEREVAASVRARLDLNRVSGLLDNKGTADIEPYSSWKVALAAGGVASAFTYSFSHNGVISALIWAAVFLVANGDPLDEDSVAGALTRIVGRVTLQSVEASQPKVRAVARAAVRGDDEYFQMKIRINELEDENANLMLWKKRRIAVDKALGDFTLDDLKGKARGAKLTIGGTKTQLLMRLVESNNVFLDLGES